MTEWYEELGIKESYFADDSVCLIHGDCRELTLSGVSAVVTDPPYELSFMGKSWDSKGVSFQKETWEKIRSYCLSGTPLLSFGGSRTQHRIACAIEDAGWKIRDMLIWVYGSGFPKSLDISKAIDKATNTEREIIGLVKGMGKQNPEWNGTAKGRKENSFCPEYAKTSPSSLSGSWSGYGTALKPAYEPIILAMNPLDKTFANNALKYGVAGLNIDECRVGYQSDYDKSQATPQGICTSKEISAIGAEPDAGRGMERLSFDRPELKGRFPANFLHDGSQEVMELFPQSKGQQGDVRGTEKSHTGDENTNCYGEYNRMAFGKRNDSDGSAGRFFYCAKASKSERGVANSHPTVKPLALMEYLCKLVRMPEYNLVIDPFCGSGTTLLACMKLGIRCVGIDSDEQSCEIATIRYLKAQSEASKWLS